MGWITYVDGVQRRGKILYHLQRIDDRLAGPHPVLPGGDRRIGVYATEANARRAAHALEEPIEAKADCGGHGRHLRLGFRCAS